MNNPVLEIEIRIRRDFNGSLLERACLDLFHFLIDTPIENLKHISFANLFKITNESLDANDLVIVSSYMTGYIDFLKECFEFIDEDNNSYDLDVEDVQQARLDGFLIHPESGDAIYQADAHIFIYFLPGNGLVRVKELINDK
ncbi:hypothetical protein ACKF11_15280 [Methylobacillus sp. Pita2]|uniref:hypothetical protein n=1 Tax=Methylobacillus sp. Pita2 TaxID=3383245 RepID=UPI0038B68C75